MRAPCLSRANLAACLSHGKPASCSAHARTAIYPSRTPYPNRDGPNRQRRPRADADPHATHAGSLASPARSVCPASPSRGGLRQLRRPLRYPARCRAATACRFCCRLARRMRRATLGFYSLVSRNRLSRRPVGRHLERHGVILTTPRRNVELPCPVSHGARLHHHRERRCRRNHHSQGEANDD